ncbi:response regulator [Shewanella sp. SNU WT4]|uniref:response regulator n=1 Tax=Shewanella sp. SNU WT4 TaxID=2590015 RepID=UPI00143D79AE|nr:response regulator [Shewanella sp. SNU WT4]
MRPLPPSAPVPAPADNSAPLLGQMRLWLASLNDDLKSPMHTINGMTQLCLQSSLEPQNRTELEAINLANHQLEWQINNLLMLAELDSQKFTLDSQALYILGLKQGLEEQWRLWGRDLQQLIFDWPQCGKIVTDGTKLQRLLSCLLHFVAKQGGTPVCRARSMADINQVNLQVEIIPSHWGGNGNLSQLEKIFDMSSGLSLAKKLAGVLGGQLRLLSFEGEFGFQFELNCERPRDGGGTGIIPQADQDLPILLVDDHGLNRQLVMAMFERLQLPLPAIAENGLEALQYLAEHRVKLVLMDIQMPVMDGVTALKRLRAQPKWQHLAVIALSANHTDSHVQGYLNIGFNAVLPKPFDFCYLKQVLHQFGIDCEEAQSVADIDKGVWPAHAALDCHKALARLNFDGELYADLLVRFATGQPQLLTQIPEAYGAGDWQTLARLLHTLKGVAASLGSDRLSHLATEAGDIINQGKEWSSESMLSLLMDIIAAINSWRELQHLNELGESISDLQLHQCLLKLQVFLQQSDAAAVTLVAQLQACRHEHLADYQSVFGLISNFEFDKALQELQPLMSKPK